MPVRHTTRRRFVYDSATSATAVIGGLHFLAGLPRVTADEAGLKSNPAQFGDDIEPLVRLIEESPADSLLERVAERIRGGRSYRDVLAALLLAGIRNVQPRPSVGFKFHCVLVVNACHLASLAGPDEDRWLPIFWGLNYFKSSQEDEAKRSGWRMKPVKESLVPDAARARQLFVEAMDSWGRRKGRRGNGGAGADDRCN